MKVIASYFGRVSCVNRGTRTVVLTRKNGEEIVADMIRRIGRHYKKGDCFRYRILRSGDKVKSQFRKIYPRKLTEKQLARIHRDVEKSLKGIDFDKI